MSNLGSKSDKIKSDNAGDAAAIDGAALLDDLAAAFKRHLVLPDGAAEVLALWVMFTHSFGVWDYSPRLLLTSPDPGCGKTVLLEMLKAVCPGGKIMANVSEAYVFHNTDRAARAKEPLTLLLDECDEARLDEKPALRGVLNAGFQRGSVVGRCEKDAQGKYVDRDYAIEAPVALAGIGDDWLPATLRSRSIAIPMDKPRPGDRYEKWRPRRHAPALKELAHRASVWAAVNGDAMAGTAPEMPAALGRARTADKWEPLIAIAAAAGDRWPAIARRVALAMSGQREPPSQGEQLLAAIRAVFDDRATDRLSSEVLAKAVWSDPMALAAALKPYRIEPGRIKIAGKQVRGYMRADFGDAWERRCPREGDGVTPSAGVRQAA